MRTLLGLVLLAGCGGSTANEPREQTLGGQGPADAGATVAASISIDAGGSCIPMRLDLVPTADFATAELFYNERLLPVKSTAVAATKEELDRELGTLVQLSREARDNYIAILERSSSSAPTLTAGRG